MYTDPRLKNKHYAWLLISDFDLNPDEITSQLGIEPTKTRVKGEYRLAGKKKPNQMINTSNQWILDSELPNNISIEKQIHFLLEKIRPHKQKFQEITKKYYTEFSCALYFYDANPGIHVDSSLLKELAELNVKLDLDIYCLAGTVSQYENLEAKKELIKQFSRYNFISPSTTESENLAESLIEIDKARQDLDVHMEDLIVFDSLSEDVFKSKLNKVVQDLDKIRTNSKKSKYLIERNESKV